MPRLPSDLQVSRPVFADQLVAESRLRLTAVEPEARALVDPPGRYLNIGGPQHDSPVSGTPREAKAFVHESGPTPAPRACGSTSSRRSCAVSGSSAAVQKMQPTRSPSSSAIHAASRLVSALAEVGDDARDEGLEGDIPAVLGGVPGTVPFDHPAEVAGSGARSTSPARAFVVEHPPDPAHRTRRVRALTLVQRPHQAVDRVRLQCVELGEGRPPGRRQPHDPATRVGRRRLPSTRPSAMNRDRMRLRYPASRSSARRNSVTGHLVAVGQFEEHPGFCEAECRAGQFWPQQPEDAGVEAVESADLAHR